MGKQQDVLFCKIAISTGMVTQPQAQKCLALCDRREQETGRRPLIGALFTKYKILAVDDVQRLNEAVAKRLGTSVAEVSGGGKRGGGKRGGGARKGGAGSGGGGRSPGGRGAGRRGTGRGQAGRKIDQATLVRGIATGVIFVGVVIGMIVIMMGKADKPPAEKPDGDDKTASANPVSPLPGEGGGDADAIAASAAAEKDNPEYDQFKATHSQALKDARRTGVLDDDPATAAKNLQAFMKRNEANYKKFSSLHDEAKSNLAGYLNPDSGGDDDDDLGDGGLGDGESEFDGEF